MLVFTSASEDLNAGTALSGRRICIDPGHGGSASGAEGIDGPGYPDEKHLVLDIALRLRTLLLSESALVIMTRTNDADVTLSARCGLANASNADIFISVHENSAGSSSVHGIETFYYDSLALPNPETNTTRYALASGAHTNYRFCAPLYDRGIKADYDGLGYHLYVLENTAMPAALSEGGFLSHPSNFKFLTNTPARRKCVKGLFEGILDFYDAAFAGLVGVVREKQSLLPVEGALCRVYLESNFSTNDYLEEQNTTGSGYYSFPRWATNMTLTVYGAYPGLIPGQKTRRLDAPAENWNSFFLDNIPGPASNFSAFETNGTVRCSWRASADDRRGWRDASSYRLYRKMTNEALYTQISILFTNSSGIYSNADATGQEGRTYLYRVNTSDGTNLSAGSFSMALTVNGKEPGPPGFLTACTQSGGILLNWTSSTDDGANARDVTGYSLMRRDTLDTNWFIRTNIPAGSGPVYSFRDSTVYQGLSYSYRVFCHDPRYSSSGSNITNLYLDQGPPHAPSSLTLSTQTPGFILNWTWSTDEKHLARDVVSYHVFKSPVNDSSFTQIAAVATNGSMVYSFTDMNVQEGTRYYYSVRSWDSSYYSPDPPVTNAVVNFLPCGKPGRPDLLESSGKIDVRWTASSDDGGGADDVLCYRIYRAVDNTWLFLAEIPSAHSADYLFTDTPQGQHQEHAYSISSFDGRFESEGKTNRITYGSPLPPESIRAVASEGRIILSWQLPQASDIASVLIRYGPEHSTAETEQNAYLALSWIFADIPKGVPYSFRLYCLDTSGQISAPSETVTALIYPAISGSAVRNNVIRRRKDDKAYIYFNPEKDEEVRITVCNIEGREVKELASGHYSAGIQLVLWDGFLNGNRKAPPGIYFIHIKSGTINRMERILVLEK